MGNPAGGDKKNIVKLAYLYFQEGRWDNAIEEYRKLLELDPEDVNTHNMLGDVYAKKNDSVQAYNEYIKVVADLTNRGQADKAALIHKKIARLDGNQLSIEARQKQNLILLHMKAEAALEAENAEEAIEAFTEILKLEPEDLIVASKLAELDEKMGRIPDAVQQYMLLGESFMKSHLFKKAQETFKKVLSMEPQNKVAHLNLAQIYTKQGSESDAKKEYLNIAEQALADNNLDDALEFANKAVELKSIEAHYLVGIVLYKQGKWTEAKNEFDILLRFKVNHVGALVYLGRVFAAMEQSDKAADAFQKALKVDKDNIQALEAWAEYCVKKKNKNEAIQTLNLLIDLILAGDEPARAVEFARTLVSVDETVTASKEKLAHVLQNGGDSNSAADIYYNLALIHENQNKAEEAGSFLKKTLQLNPSHAKAFEKSREGIEGEKSSVAAASAGAGEDRAHHSAKTSSPEQSKAQVVDVSPQDALKAQIAIADQYVKEGLLDEAIDIYQQLLEVDPDNAEIKKKINTVYTAYAKTGTDLTGVFDSSPKAEADEKKTISEAPVKTEEPAKKSLKELETKAREDADRQVRIELEKRAREDAEKKAREDADRQVQMELERRAREEAEKKASEDANKRARAELERIAREDAEKKAREDADRQVQMELERRAREEADKKASEEIKRLAVEKEKQVLAPPTVPVKAEKVLPAMGGLDDMVVLAEANLLRSQGRDEEAAKIYRTIMEAHPDNEDVRKKLTAIEELLKSKGSQSESLKTPPILKVVEKTPAPTPSPSSKDHENDSNIKKKSNKIGYV